MRETVCRSYSEIRMSALKRAIKEQERSVRSYSLNIAVVAVAVLVIVSGRCEARCEVSVEV